jgi:hypothetical protein
MLLHQLGLTENTLQPITRTANQEHLNAGDSADHSREETGLRGTLLVLIISPDDPGHRRRHRQQSWQL